MLMKIRDYLSNIHISWLIVYLSITMYFLYPMMSSSNAPSPFIKNSIFGYGRFCGPGPADEELWDGSQPIDEVDSACQEHDREYYQCHVDFEREVGYGVPKFIHQLMPLRGYLPNLLFPKSYFVTAYITFQRYYKCMNLADKHFVKYLEKKWKLNQFPRWWKNLSLAPRQLTGIEGFDEACTLGVSWRPISSYFYWPSFFSSFNVTSPAEAAAASASVSVNPAIAAPGVYGSTAVGPIATASQPAVRSYCLLLSKTYWDIVINVFRKAVDDDQYYLPEPLSEIDEADADRLPRLPSEVPPEMVLA